MKSHYSILRENLRNARIDRGFNLNELSFLSNVKVNEISKTEKGQWLPCLHVILKIAEALDVTLIELMPDYAKKCSEQTLLNNNLKKLSKNEKAILTEIIPILIEHFSIDRSDYNKTEVDPVSIGIKIRNMRLNKGMSVNKLCTDSNINYRMYHPIELGQTSRIRLETIELIAEALDITAFEILIDYFNAYKYLLKEYFPEIEILNETTEYECKLIYNIVNSIMEQLIK